MDDFDPSECGKCGVRHPARMDCSTADAIASGVTVNNPEGSTVNPTTGLLWGERSW